ncbi:hypothetical protein LCL95_04520 [Bacillus timonensis]|nr:hypothetical protein [Bacillus timonensis]
MFTTIVKHNKADIDDQLIDLGLMQIGNRFIFHTNNQKELCTILSNKMKNELLFQFQESLNFEEYEQIHKVICSISELIDGKIDDSMCRLGYLENGESAYIVTNWKKWSFFIEKAKIKSMEGVNVLVLNALKAKIDSGILISYELKQSIKDEFCINKCTLITTTGERTIVGDKLLIEPISLLL